MEKVLMEVAVRGAVLNDIGRWGLRCGISVTNDATGSYSLLSLSRPIAWMQSGLENDEDTFGGFPDGFRSTTPMAMERPLNWSLPVMGKANHPANCTCHANIKTKNDCQNTER